MQILLIDHHELFRDGLRHMLQKLPCGVEELLEEGDWQKGLKCVERHPDLDLVLLEPNSYGCSGADSVRIFRERYPHIPLVVVSAAEDAGMINKIMNYGARGFVGKSSPESVLLNALKLILAGDIYVPQQMLRYLSSPGEYRLTQRQIQVLNCLSEGFSNKQISEKFNLAESTVKVHVAAVYQVLRVRNRLEAAGLASRIGFGIKHQVARISTARSVTA